MNDQHPPPSRSHAPQSISKEENGDDRIFETWMNDWVAVARRGVSTSKALRNTIMKEGKVAIAKTNKLDSRACDTDTLNHQRASSHKSLRIRSNSHERWKECSTIRTRGSLCQLERPRPLVTATRHLLGCYFHIHLPL